jgi:DNA-binding LacI/PurR family transcriptional regulator
MRAKKVDPETGKSAATLWDITALAGVSIATVSRVLNSKPHVSSAVRKKVIDAALELGYIDKPPVSSPETEPPRLIGLTSASMRSGEYAEILAGVIEALHARNIRPIICPIPYRHNCGMPLLERVMHYTTEGALILGTTDEDEELVEVYQSGFPLVIINPSRPVNTYLPVVAPARWSAAKSATEHLLSLGHRHIRTIAARFSQYSSQFNFDNTDSIAGFQAALLAAGLPATSELVYECKRNTKESAYQATLHLLSQADPPTAILALSDVMAIGALQAAHDKGLEVPKQLSIVGFDDLELARMAVPELTAIQQPFQEMGRIGVDMLYRLMNGQKLDAARVELSTRLVFRQSTAPPYSSDYTKL